MRKTVEVISLAALLLCAFVANAQVPRYDLLLKGGHVVDPANGLDAKMDVAVSLGRIAAVEKDIPVNRSEEHTSELQSQSNLVCRLLLEKKKREAQGAGASVTTRFLGLEPQRLHRAVREHDQNLPNLRRARHGAIPPRLAHLGRGRPHNP